MSEIRKDPASSTWIILAAERGKRPWDFKEEKPKESKKKSRGCPFCPSGEEMKTPKPEHAIWPGVIDKETGLWQTRVLSNKFPALTPDSELTQGQVGELYHMLSGVGGHEVIVDSPNHNDTLATMSEKQIGILLRTYRERYRFWWRDPRMVYLLIYRNSGKAAGASLVHPHSQLISTPLIPPRVFDELEEGRNFYEHNGECVFCKIREVESEAEPNRKIYENKTIFAFCPYASRFPFEVWILSKHHYSTLEGIPRKKMRLLAEAISQVFKRMEKVLGDFPYNMVLHVAPLRTPGLLYYHWHFEILPRLAMPAGFEWGAGIYINSISPEDAAKSLREAL